jgi:hypothetical protein
LHLSSQALAPLNAGAGVKTAIATGGITGRADGCARNIGSSALQQASLDTGIQPRRTPQSVAIRCEPQAQWNELCGPLRSCCLHSDFVMQITQVRTLAGPNLYQHRPILVLYLDPARYRDKESREYAGFNARLLATLPGWREHRRCHAGGFVERLNEGACFPHVIERIAHELSGPAGIQVGFGKAHATDEPGV